MTWHFLQSLKGEKVSKKRPLPSHPVKNDKIALDNSIIDGADDIENVCSMSLVIRIMLSF